jgi:hypothetical protein
VVKCLIDDESLGEENWVVAFTAGLAFWYYMGHLKVKRGEKEVRKIRIVCSGGLLRVVEDNS